jgi:hypothetical protein
MFKRNSLAVLVATAVVGFGGFAINASASDGAGNASATIVAPIKATENTAMNFGSVSPDELIATTVVLDPGGLGVSSGDGAGLVPLSGAQEGIFDVTGAAVAYDITVQPGASTLTSGLNTMSVDTFTASKASGTDASNDTFSVGATLRVGINQAAGAPYSGTYTVTVNYQ